MSSANTKSKYCPSCGLLFERKSHDPNWSERKYCSRRCAREKREVNEKKYEAAILEFASKRSSSFCPSEVAKWLNNESWRGELKAIQSAARRLYLNEKIRIQQKNQDIRFLPTKGPIRLKSK